MRSTFGVGDLSTIILVPLVLGQIIFQMFHPASSISMCKTRAPTKLWVMLGGCYVKGYDYVLSLNSFTGGGRFIPG